MNNQEINELVARKLGWTIAPDKIDPLFRYWFSPDRKLVRDDMLPDYCHSIAAAWEVCEKIKNEYLLTLWWHDGEWECDIEMTHGAFKTNADTAPMAICLAFLKLGDK